jgi:hypothetical protein
MTRDKKAPVIKADVCKWSQQPSTLTVAHQIRELSDLKPVQCETLTDIATLA